MKQRLLNIAFTLSLVVMLACTAHAITYTDNFDSGAQLAWENQRGNWVADNLDNNVYKALFPSNNPVTASTLPYELTDFTAEVDISGLGDGGLWARANSTATMGVMLIMHSYDIYWHVITNPSSGPWGVYGYKSRSGSSVHVKLTGVGNILSAYLDGASTPITTLDLTSIPGYSSGRFGLYSNSGMTFDNVSLTYTPSTTVPEPATMFLLGLGLIGIAGVRRMLN